jgi:hypothetical protein
MRSASVRIGANNTSSPSVSCGMAFPLLGNVGDEHGARLVGVLQRHATERRRGLQVLRDLGRDLPALFVVEMLAEPALRQLCEKLRRRQRRVARMRLCTRTEQRCRSADREAFEELPPARFRLHRVILVKKGQKALATEVTENTEEGRE